MRWGCDANIVETDHISMAKAPGQARGERKQLIKALKAATAERDHVRWDHRWVIRSQRRGLPKTALMALIRLAWTAANGDVSGLLAALKPTMAMLSGGGEKKLYPDSKEDQAAIVAQWSREEQGKEFGVHTKGGPHKAHRPQYQELLDRRTFCQSRPAVERIKCVNQQNPEPAADPKGRARCGKSSSPERMAKTAQGG